MKDIMKKMLCFAIALTMASLPVLSASAYSSDEIISSYNISSDPSQVSVDFLSSTTTDREIIENAAALIVEGALNFEEEVDISSFKISVDDIGTLYECVRYAHPELISLASTYGYGYYQDGTIAYFKLYYLFDESEKDVYYTPLNNEVDKIVNEANKLHNDFSKVLYVHDYLVSNCEYETAVYDSTAQVDPFVYSAYGCLVDKRAVCQGYSLAYKLILDKLGIDVWYAISDTMNHIWNTVTLDGKTYHIDVTYDDPIPDCYSRVYHNNFLCTDEEITNNGHSDWVTTDTISTESYSGRFWDYVDGKVLFSGNDMIYTIYDTDSKGESIEKRNIYTFSTETIESSLPSNKWFSMEETSLYIGSFSKIALVDNVLYYSVYNGINAITLDGKYEQNVYTLPDTATGRMYGFDYQNGVFYGAVSATPNESSTVIELNLDSFNMPVTIGDVDCNGTINVADAIMLQKYVVSIITLDSCGRQAADINGDGSVSIADALLLQKKIAGVITGFNAA